MVSTVSTPRLPTACGAVVATIRPPSRRRPSPQRPQSRCHLRLSAGFMVPPITSERRGTKAGRSSRRAPPLRGSGARTALPWCHRRRGHGRRDLPNRLILVHARDLGELLGRRQCWCWDGGRQPTRSNSASAAIGFVIADPWAPPASRGRASSVVPPRLPVWPSPTGSETHRDRRATLTRCPLSLVASRRRYHQGCTELHSLGPS